MFFFSENLYKKILLDPIIECGAEELNIVSGFATPTMATKHIIDIADILKNSQNFKVNLLIGMIPRCNMGVNSHENFKTLTENKYKISFSCGYTYNTHPVHSKIYIFSKNGTPVKSFIGSANYTQTGFGSRQLEVITDSDPIKAMEYFAMIDSKSILCNHPDVEEYVKIIEEQKYRNSFTSVDRENIEPHNVGSSLQNNSSIKVSLLAYDGEVGHHSGLNWGQREGRNPNQAYIGLNSEIVKMDFFPLRGSIFTILTDDNKSIICSMSQESSISPDRAKAIHSTSNNSLLGEYFRNRLGLANGQYVTKADLERYGRTDVTFTKIDDETYYMDFSVN